MADILETTRLLSSVASVQVETTAPLKLQGAGGLTILTTAVFAVGEMAGSGVLALPVALTGSGYAGIMLNVACALVSAYTGLLLGRCWTLVTLRYPTYQLYARSPYSDIGQVTFGKPGRVLVSCAINLTLFGVSVVFLLLSSENVHSLVKTAGKDISLCYWPLVIAGVLCPIGWLGTPKDFWPVAVGAVISTSLACVLIVTNMALDSRGLEPSFHPSVSFQSLFTAFGTICFAFGGHPAFPTFQADMKQPEKFGQAILISYVILLVMYLPVAVTGYTIYGAAAQENILQNLSPGPLLYVVQCLITFHLLCGYVIVINPVCQGLEEMLGILPRFSLARVLARTALMGLVLFVAETVPTFGAILSLVGGSTITLLAYILPPVFYLRLASMEGDWPRVSVSLHEKTACVIIMTIGVTAGVASTYSAIVNLVGGSLSRPCYVGL